MKTPDSVGRREFIGVSALAGAALAAGPAASSAALASPAEAKLEGRIAFAPATWYRPYKSKPASAAATRTWVQFDLGSPLSVDAVRLYPSFDLGDAKNPSKGFPARLKVEGAESGNFSSPALLFDHTQRDLPDPNDRMVYLPLAGTDRKWRYIRVTATVLRPSGDDAAFALCLSKVDVLSGGRNAAELCPASADPQYGNPAELKQLTRRARPQGEGIINDHPANVTPASAWHRPPEPARVPRTGVTLQGGIFHQAMEDNIGYLLGSFSVEEMLRPFWQRAGKPIPAGLRRPNPGWDVMLAGSMAGRFLMGAGNTLRWREHAELRRRMNAIVDGIEECRQPNGYIMGYPENEMLVSERAAYTRAWVTHGLIEAGLAGNPKAFGLLRGYYDWYNRNPYLPELLRGAIQGVQGMVANTRMYFTSVGKPEDIQVIQRYFQENYWLDGLAKRDKAMAWQYPYDRPHNYLITDFEAYLDLYRATGERRYRDAVEGAWELYHDNWEHVGGSIAITEFGEFPPQSYRLKPQFSFCETGELCGSSFWAFLNQRLLMLDPSQERCAAEIEKSIYNVGIANQVDARGLMYHARLVGQKGDVAVGYCDNSCCEGQGTRLIGSLPEHIYSIVDDGPDAGLMVNLFAPSTIDWQSGGTRVRVAAATQFPYGNEVKLTFSADAPARFTLRVRTPGWAAGPMPIRANGVVAATGAPGTYVKLAREWRTGDTVTFTLPMGFKLTEYTGLDQIAGHKRYALEYGPILLALKDSDDARLLHRGSRAAQFIEQLQPVPGRPLQFNIAGNPGRRYVPYFAIKNELFTCFPVIDPA